MGRSSVPHRIRKLPEEMTVINETISTTGKWAIAFAQHFKPTLCYDVAALNRVTGECKRVHFGDDKSQALTCWNEFRNKMTAPRTPSEEEEVDKYHIFGPN